MINRIIKLSVKWREITLFLLFAIILWGINSYQTMPIDAFPDISPVMVPIFAEADGMAPEEIERLITYPIETKMNGLPGVEKVKSTSAFGMAVIYVYFSEKTDIYFARQLVNERLNSSLSDLPDLKDPPKLGPISSGLGQIFIYYLTATDDIDTNGKDKLTYLRDLNDWVIKFQLQTIPGVTDILSVGGHILQYQIVVDPYALQKFKISLENIEEAVHKNNSNTGGQYLTLGSEEHLIRGIGLLSNLDEIRQIPIKVENGIPIKIEDVAKVQFGKAIRRGVVSRNGNEEVVSGLVLKLYGENTSEVIERLYKKIPEIQKGLPNGVKIVPYYEQAHLVDQATWTVKKSLLQGAILVIIVLMVLLGSLRASLIVAMALPFCACTAFIGMRLFGISANLMSLGGIAIGLGMLVDGSIVVVENVVRHLTKKDPNKRSTEKIVVEAAKEVGKPITFAILIVVAVFLPILSLEGTEGKMFSPMAYTICFALLGSILAALAMAPALSFLFLKDEVEKETRFFKFLKPYYRKSLNATLRKPIRTVMAAVIATLLSFFAIWNLGTEFIPTLEEGSIMIGATMAPSISLDEAVKTVQSLEKRLIKIKDVHEVISRIGRPEAGSHPHPVNYSEIHIELKPQNEWVEYTSKSQIQDRVREELKSVTGLTTNFTQPIQNAFDELLSGTKAQIAINIYGENLDVLKTKAEEVLHATQKVNGFTDVSAEQSFGQPQIKIIANREACARYGIEISEILELVETAIGGRVIDQLYLNTRRYDIYLRYKEIDRSDINSLKQLIIHSDNDKIVSLEQVAEIKMIEGPIQINRQNSQRRWVVQGNVTGRALSEVVEDIRQAISQKVNLPTGYFIEFGGQFENQQRAMGKLKIIIPVVIGVIFLLLWLTFNSIRHASIVILNVPMALIGGVTGLILTGQYLSVPASVGFIALFGIAMQDAVVLITDFNDYRKMGLELNSAIVDGAMIRFRAVLMTTLTTLLGLLPLLLSTSAGSEIQRPLAATVVFGLASSTLLTLYVIPSVYKIVEEKYLMHLPEKGLETTNGE